MHDSTPASQLIRIDARHIFVAGITALMLQCTNQDEYRLEVNQLAAILNADCNCHVRSKNLFLPALSVNCSLARPKVPRIVYTYNSLLLKSLFTDEKLGQMSDITLRDRPLQVDLPALEISRLQGEFDVDKRQSIKLNELASNLENNTKIYSSLSSYVFEKLSEQIADTAERSEFSILSWSSWLTVFNTTVATGAFLYCIYITLKLRAIAVLLVASAHAARAQIYEEVQRTLRLTPKQTSTVAMVPSNFGNLSYRNIISLTEQHIPTDIVSVLTWLTILTVGMALLYKTFKRPAFGPLTQVFIEIKNARDNIILHWGSLTHVPGNYRIRKTPTPMGNIKIRGLKLSFDARVKFLEKGTGFEYNPLKTRYISPWHAFQIRRLIAHGNYILAIVVTNTSRTITQIVHLHVEPQNFNWGDRPPPFVPETEQGTTAEAAAATAQMLAKTEPVQSADAQTGTDDNNQTAFIRWQSQNQPYAGVGRGAMVRWHLNR